jgi:hypothetical protein
VAWTGTDKKGQYDTLAFSASLQNEKYKPLITVKEARKLLGADARGMSDDQIEELILLLTSTAEDFLQDKGSKL